MGKINLGHGIWSLRATWHNGPGLRIALWVQGCSLLCTKVCLNPHYLDPKKGFEYCLDEVFEKIEEVRKISPGKVEGVTVLGGEPIDQAQAVSKFFSWAQSHGLSTMLYTGHVYEELQKKSSEIFNELFSRTDILVDGPFKEREYDNKLIWRGSGNQRILCLSNRYNNDEIEAAIKAQGKSYSILVTADGKISVSGLQSRKGARQIEKILEK